LRSPITTIKTTAQLLLKRIQADKLDLADLSARLHTVNAMSDRLNLLVGDLLDTTRLRTGQLQLRPEALDLARLVRQIVDELRVQLGVQFPLSLSIDGVLPTINADPYRIQQVLSNVLQNAIKYSPAGGEVDVNLRSQDAGVLLSVSDHGIGLPADAAEAIFEPFGRASNAKRAQMPGLGLGLYITRQIVEQHGGRIWAQSAGEGTGTLVCIWLPTELPNETLPWYAARISSGERWSLTGA
jgi:signal transduction histidine kinase